MGGGGRGGGDQADVIDQSGKTRSKVTCVGAHNNTNN